LASLKGCLDAEVMKSHRVLQDQSVNVLLVYLW